MEIQTRKTEQIVFAQSAKEMFGKYVAENVIKTWYEDFVDTTTGETRKVERHDILFTRGTKIDEKNTDSVEFYLQTHDIEGIYVSDQCRQSKERESSVLKVYKAKVEIGSKKFVYVCQATNIDMAKAIVADYIELTETLDFKFFSVGEMDCGTILNRDKGEFIKLKEGAKEESLFEEGEGEAPEEKKEEEKKTVSYYDIKLDTTLRTIAKTAGEKDVVLTSTHYFLVESDDADEAKEKCIEWLRLYNNENTVVESATTLEANPFKCKKVIDREFVDTYLELPNPLP